MGIRPLKSVPTAISPERARLRDAIAARDELKARTVALAAAEDSAMRSEWSSNAELQAARVKLEQAEQLAADNAVQLHMKQPPIPGQTPAAARAAVTAIEDAIEATKRARTHLASQRSGEKGRPNSGVESRLSFAETAVHEAVQALLWSSPEVLRLLQGIELAQRTRLELMAALHEIGAPPGDLWRHTVVNVEFSDDLRKAWAIAVKALESDCSAELPH